MLNTLGIEDGAEVELNINAKKDALIVKAVKPVRLVRGRHRIEDLVAAMPKNYKPQEMEWSTQGQEVW